MPEYFEISFLFRNKKQNLNEIKNKFSAEFGIRDGEHYVGESKFPILKKRDVSLLYYNFEGTNFYQFIIGLPNKFFHTKSFDFELKELSDFVDACFELHDEILYALCCYELTVNFLEDIDFLEGVDDEIINMFPIAFVKKDIMVGLTPTKKLKNSNLFVNHDAQDLFSVM